MKFVFKRTGTIVESTNPFVIAQMKHSDAYTEVVEVKETKLQREQRKTKKIREDADNVI
jgi:hypothetical protein